MMLVVSSLKNADYADDAGSTAQRSNRSSIQINRFDQVKQSRFWLAEVSRQNEVPPTNRIVIERRGEKTGQTWDVLAKEETRMGEHQHQLALAIRPIFWLNKQS